MSDIPRKPPALSWPNSTLVTEFKRPWGHSSSFRTINIRATRLSIPPSPLEGAEMPGGLIEMVVVGKGWTGRLLLMQNSIRQLYSVQGS